MIAFARQRGNSCQRASQLLERKTQVISKSSQCDAFRHNSAIREFGGAKRNHQIRNMNASQLPINTPVMKGVTSKPESPESNFA